MRACWKCEVIDKNHLRLGLALQVDPWYIKYLIGQEAGDDPSSICTRPQGFGGPKKFEWMKNLHCVLHCMHGMDVSATNAMSDGTKGPHVPRGCTPLSSWRSCAIKKNLHFLSCITKTGQIFINLFSWVDIHNIYYIIKTGNQIYWCLFSFKPYHF